MKKFNELTSNEIKKYCNGCGGKGGFINPPEFLFHASCNHHDYLYYCGDTESDRKKADNSFYNYMRLDIANESRWYKRVYYKIWAYTYFKTVRLFGSKYFNYKKVNYDR